MVNDRERTAHGAGRRGTVRVHGSGGWLHGSAAVPRITQPGCLIRAGMPWSWMEETASLFSSPGATLTHTRRAAAPGK